jgi:hypothetical protein
MPRLTQAVSKNPMCIDSMPLHRLRQRERYLRQRNQPPAPTASAGDLKDSSPTILILVFVCKRDCACRFSVLRGSMRLVFRRC